MGDYQPDEPSSPVAAVGAAKAAARPHLKSGSSNPNMNGPLYMQTSGSNVVLVRRLKRKEDGTWKHLARWFVENQIGAYPPSPQAFEHPSRAGCEAHAQDMLLPSSLPSDHLAGDQLARNASGNRP